MCFQLFFNRIFSSFACHEPLFTSQIPPFTDNLFYFSLIRYKFDDVYIKFLKTKKMKKTLFLFIAALMGVSVMAQNSTNLKLNLLKNKIYRLKSTSEQTISQTVNGIQQTTNVNSNSVFSIKMMDAKTDFFVAEIRFDTIVNQTNAMGKISNISSALEGNIKSTEMADVMTCIMNRMSKNALFVKMDYTGKVIEIVNLKMFADIVTNDTSTITGQAAEIIKAQIKNTISDKALKTMIEGNTANLPGKEVSKGDKWEILMNMSAGGMSLDVNTVYQLDALKGNAADITAESNIKASDNAAPMEYGAAKITYGDIKGLSKSNMVIDTQSGMLINNSSKTHISGTLNVNAPGMSMQIPLEIDSEATVIALP